MKIEFRRENLALVARPLIAATVIAAVVMAIGALPALTVVMATANRASGAIATLPESLATPPLPQRTVLLDAEGEIIASIYDQNRIEVPLSEISLPMQQAMLAIEDARFYDHRGVDLRGTLRAALSNFLTGSVQQGGSTLTQQYVKNVLVISADSAEEVRAAQETSVARKIRELRYALGVERQFTKEQILTGYLNIAYFGESSYGVESAAHRFFSKRAKDLTPVEAATLASLVQRPGEFDPFSQPEKAEARRNVVLKNMANLGYITQEEGSRYQEIPLASTLKRGTVFNGCADSDSPFFCEYVLNTLLNDPAMGDTPEARENFIKQGGLTITTTMQPNAQLAAQKAVDEAIPRDDESLKAAAISMVVPQTGHVVAMAQNRSWGTEGIGNTTYNYNTDIAHGGTAGMQAGSTFKVFTLAAALDMGFGPATEIKAPFRKEFTGFVDCYTGAPFPPYEVKNASGKGWYTMSRATAASINTYFVGLEELTGLCRPIDIAMDLGVKTGAGDELERVPSFTLGSAPVTPLMMAGAFGGIANHGMYCPPVAITQIINRNGESIPVPTSPCRRVLSEGTADSVTMLLRGVMGGGTGSTFALDRDSAGKTGTTDESAAVWFVGYTPELSAAVWVGDPRGGSKYPLRDIEINGEYYSQVYGSSLPGPIWKAAMTGALVDAPKTSFQIKPRWKMGDAGIGPTKPVKEVVEILPIDPNAPVDPNAPGAPVVPPAAPVTPVPPVPAQP